MSRSSTRTSFRVIPFSAAFRYPFDLEPYRAAHLRVRDGGGSRGGGAPGGPRRRGPPMSSAADTRAVARSPCAAITIRKLRIVLPPRPALVANYCRQCLQNAPTVLYRPALGAVKEYEGRLRPSAT